VTHERLRAALADRYRLERELGQGGMATVYLAHDLKHDRKVAIKVLRPELAAVLGAERFLSEIKTTANLQHPHILPLHDSGEARDAGDPMGRPYLFYVMPFIEGESLRDRLTREKQLPIAEAVRIATEVASALDYAHRHGVIHRDIKPENILLHDGRALVADFGIALAASKAGGSRMTETGMSLGTPTYMSPEQAMGEREITARSDVYALGCMTYEMLIGEPPFTGPTAQAIVAKVMTEKPASLIARRDRIPPAVEEAVLTALEKLPADRFASAAEFAAALAGAGSATRRLGGSASSARAAEPPSRRALWLATLVGTGAVIAAFLAGQRSGRAHAPVRLPSRLAIVAPVVGTGGTSLTRQLAITPAGDAIVYAGSDAQGENTLYLQRLDAADPTEISGSHGLRSPEISRDGRWLFAFGPTTGAFRLPLEGGTPRQLPARLARSALGTWGPDGSYWFTDANASGVARLTPDDSVIPLPRDKARGLRVDQVLGDGRTALAVRAPAGTASGPGVFLDLKTGDVSPLVEGPVVELRLAAGELLAVLPSGVLTATPFDLRGRKATGPPVEVATGISLSGTGVAQFAVADDGTLAYLPEAPRTLMLLDRGGAVRPALEERRNFHAPKFSPDGRRLSFDVAGSDGRDVWLLTLDQHTLSRATFDRDGHDATWTPDGRFLTYISFKSGPLGIFRARPGSTALADSLIASASLTYTGTWLRDGSALISTGNDLQGQSSSDIVIVRNGGRGPIEPLVASPFQEAYPVPSPDQRWLAFVSDQSGRNEVYVQPLSGDGDQVQVSQEGGTEPVWGPDGHEIFFRGTRGEGDVELMAATVRTAPEFSVLNRRALFSIAEMVGSAPHANYDISPDGRTFAMVRRSPATRIIVIQNLPELLRALRSPSAGRQSP
jgi:serine/threonine-protein kinase